MANGDKRAWIFDGVTMVAVLLGLTFGAIELRQIRNAQEAQTVLQLFETLQSPEFIEGTQLIWELPTGLSADELREIESSEEGLLMQRVTMTFEGLGMMVYRGDVSLEWVDELFRNITVMSWDKFEPLVMDQREEVGYGGIMEWHQWLTERLRERLDGENPVPAYEAYRDWKDPRG